MLSVYIFFSCRLSDEHVGYDRSSHFYDSVRRDEVSYNGGVGGGVSLRRNYPPPPDGSEFGGVARGARLRPYPRVQQYIPSSSRGDPLDYRWQNSAPPPPPPPTASYRCVNFIIICCA